MKHVFRSINIYFVSFVLLLLMSCTTVQETSAPQQQQQQIPIPDNKYDSEFPIKSVSDELDFVSGTVKKLDCLAFYMTYQFPPGNQIDEHHLTKDILKNQSISSGVVNESVSGTAVVIYFDGNMVGLLTCAHVVDFPDTLTTRYDNGEGPIELISVKIKQQNYVKDLPSGDDIEVLATDEKRDIALLGKKLEERGDMLPVLNYPVGNSKDLDWGSQVYVMGYPVGQLMVTRAIVSNPDKAHKGRFLTDALYNRGISGSPVLAIRDGVPNFELVGMASSASAKQVYYVKPGKDAPEYLNPDDPYTGPLYTDQYKDIKYGVTFNVSIEAITDFINKNNDLLYKKGFMVDRFFK